MQVGKGVAFLLAVLVVFVAGCGKSGRARTASVTGTVTYQGKPADKAAVTFFPEQGRPAAGVTDSQGKFTLSTFASGDGAVLGKHKVTITDYSPVEPPPMPGMPGAESYKPPKPRFPAKYADPTNTPLTAVVKDAGKNDFTFEMTN